MSILRVVASCPGEHGDACGSVQPPYVRLNMDLCELIMDDNNLLSHVIRAGHLLGPQEQVQTKPSGLKRGIAELPEELLAHIFGEIYHAADVQTRLSVALTLSHVSRRLRSIALNLPEVWTCLDSSDSHEMLALCVQRGK